MTLSQHPSVSLSLSLMQLLSFWAAGWCDTEAGRPVTHHQGLMVWHSRPRGHRNGLVQVYLWVYRFFLFPLQSTDRLPVMMEVMRGPMILLCDIFFYSSSVSLCLIKYSTAISGAALCFFFSSFMVCSLELENHLAGTSTGCLFGVLLQHLNFILLI